MGAPEPEKPSLPKAASGGPPVLVDGRYRVESEIGRGGMGVVYLARDEGLGRAVALKIVAPRWATDPASIAGFQHEAKALASVRSQHVVQIYAFGAHEASYFFAMEYVRGRSLEAILDEHVAHGERLPLHRAVTILARVAEGLASVHAAGMVHRDVKPANVIIEEDTGRAVLVDFGLAVPDNYTNLLMVAGTPPYMAPEQVGLRGSGATITPRTDVWALGCMAFEMLTGRLPFTAETYGDLLRQLTFRSAPAVSSVRADLGVFDAVLAKALAKDPDARYEGCAAMVADLATASESWLALSVRRSLPPPPMVVRGISILVVDDDPAFRRFAARAAQLAFYRKPIRVTVAASGQDAIVSAFKEPPDLVLLDYDMPGLDGIDTLSRLRALPGGNRARVVLVSGQAGAKERWRFSIMGVRDFIAKPVELQELVTTIGAIADRSGWASIEDETQT